MKIFSTMDTNLRNARLKFFLNIVLPSIFAVILFVVTLFFVVLPHFEKSMMDKKREMITELTNTATSILAKYNKDEVDGILTREEAQSTAISRIQYLRYGDENKDYFWITDMQPVMIVHPYRPDLNGKDLSSFKDPHGKKMFVEFVEVVKANQHGYVEYMWQWKDDAEHIVPKLSYVKEFKPWAWIIGTGIYIEDVKAEIAALNSRFTIISAIISIIIALILFYSGRQSFNIERKRISAEYELSRSREKYRSMVDASTDGLLMLMNNKIIFVNPVFEEMYRKQASEILNLSIQDILEIPEDFKSILLKSDHSFGQKLFECKIFTNENRILDVVVNANAVKFHDQNAIVFSVKDVSLDKIAKEESSQNREKFQALMDKLDQGIFRTSLDSKGRFVEANKTAMQILGFKNSSELKGLYILDFFVEKEDKLNFKNELLKTGFIRNRVLKLRKKNGKYIYALVSLIVVNDSNGPKFCDGIIQNVPSTNYLETDDKSTVFNGFIQSILRPACVVANKIVYLKYDVDIKTLALKMTKENVSVIVLTGPEEETLGYVSDQNLRSRVLTVPSVSNLKAFEIMSSPINPVDETESIMALSSIIEKAKDGIIFTQDKDGKLGGFINALSLNQLSELVPVKLIALVANASSSVELRIIYNDYVRTLIPLVELNTIPQLMLSALSVISESISQRIIELGILKFGPPPVAFSFISLGSEGRKEQTLNTDQDNAIVFEDTDDPNIKEYFNALAKFVCTSLDEVGYTFCKGGIMAMNPTYCQPLSVWKSYFVKWISNGNAKDLLDISVFFDFRLTYGEESFVENLREHINQLTLRNPAYLLLLAQNNLKLKPQVGFWGNILPDSAGLPPDTVNIKDAIMPIVNFARIYALQNQVNAAGTQDRLNSLFRNTHLSEQTFRNISQSLDILQIMRLNHQANLVKNGLKADNLINTKLLSDIDQAVMKKVLSHINTMLSKLSYDFKGTL